MRWHFPSEHLRNKRRNEKLVHRWELKFLWWPTRMSNFEMAWMETVARKPQPVQPAKGRRLYQYGPAHYALQQDKQGYVQSELVVMGASGGVGGGVASQQVQMGVGGGGGSGFSSAQNSGAALQGGFGQPAFSIPNLRGQGLAHVERAPHGRDDPPTS